MILLFPYVFMYFITVHGGGGGGGGGGIGGGVIKHLLPTIGRYKPGIVGMCRH